MMKFKIKITEDGLKFLNNIESIKREKAISFDKIEKMGSLKRVSKDKFIFVIISLAYYEGAWYWKTEIMNENDYEYIIELPTTLNKKIKDI